MDVHKVMLPDRDDYVVHMRGPVVLARSSRLERSAIDGSLSFPDDIELKEVEQAGLKGTLDAFYMYACQWHTIQLCDHASTGNQFDKPTDPNALKEMMINRVSDDQRVWFPLAR